ncbi:hypothetical protein K438DRAFT_1769541 [Mycena galopus ATCC 62051]|nr:hypothetical protein K438DRAFT_1769541 [Mycena galopus ATCC 62051]
MHRLYMEQADISRAPTPRQAMPNPIAARGRSSRTQEAGQSWRSRRATMARGKEEIADLIRLHSHSTLFLPVHGARRANSLESVDPTGVAARASLQRSRRGFGLDPGAWVQELKMPGPSSFNCIAWRVAQVLSCCGNLHSASIFINVRPLQTKRGGTIVPHFGNTQSKDRPALSIRPQLLFTSLIRSQCFCRSHSFCSLLWRGNQSSNTAAIIYLKFLHKSCLPKDPGFFEFSYGVYLRRLKIIGPNSFQCASQDSVDSTALSLAALSIPQYSLPFAIQGAQQRPATLKR